MWRCLECGALKDPSFGSDSICGSCTGEMTTIVLRNDLKLSLTDDDVELIKALLEQDYSELELETRAGIRDLHDRIELQARVQQNARESLSLPGIMTRRRDKAKLGLGFSDELD